MFCIENSTSLGSLQKFEGAAGEFKRGLGSRYPLISGPENVKSTTCFGKEHNEKCDIIATSNYSSSSIFNIPFFSYINIFHVIFISILDQNNAFQGSSEQEWLSVCAVSARYRFVRINTQSGYRLGKNILPEGCCRNSI